jgi:tetratricopeptide (TPR) repeat protein
MKMFLILCVFSAVAPPCLWDSDTLDNELRGLPEAFDLVVGRFHKHSDAYYQARVDAILGNWSKSVAPTYAEFDDLAVAYEHLGQRDLAIEVMSEKALLLKSAPDEEHQYRCYANLGTFYAHAGDFERGLQNLRKAIAINPNAHFGRESFQIELIEYVAAASADSELWSQSSFLRYAGYALPPFIGVDVPRMAESDPRRVSRERSEVRELSRDDAWKAMAGMVRFGGLEGAELYRSLGELFLSSHDLHLAWWSFGRAVERGHPAAGVIQGIRNSIESHWREANGHNGQQMQVPTDSDYEAVRSAADKWLEAFQELESEAIAQGDDVASDAVLKRLLADSTIRVPAPVLGAGMSGRVLTLLFGLAMGAMIILLAIMRRRRA